MLSRILELIAGTVALVCFAVAAKAFIELQQMKRAAKVGLVTLPPRRRRRRLRHAS